MTAEVIPLFPADQEQTCFTCQHARFPLNAQGFESTWCLIYEERIDSEIYAAENCFSYTYCPEGDQPVEDLPHLVEGE